MDDFDLPLGEIDLPPGEVAYDPNAMTILDPQAKERLSHSTLKLARSCERKYQRTRLLHNRQPRETSPSLSFGKAFGAGAQHYMLLRTLGHSPQVALDSALHEAWLQYWPIEEDERKFQTRVIRTLELSQPFQERMLLRYEIAEFRGKLASELSFSLDIDERYYFVGYIDLVLRSRDTGRYAVTDYKTTALRGEDLAPYYRYSDQGVGYSIALDAIVGAELAEFDVSYWVAQLAGNGKAALFDARFSEYTFAKTLRDRFEWFLKLYFDVNYLKSLRGLDVYPRRDSCKAYNRVCNFFSDCGLTATDRPALYVPDDIVYDFNYNLDDLFEDHRRRLSIITSA